MYLDNLISPSLAVLADPVNAIRRLLNPTLVSFGLLANLAALSRRGALEGVDGILDIGANRGQFAYMVSRVCPGVPVFSFEPHPGCVAALRRTFSRFKIAGQIYECGLADHEGNLTLNTYPEDVNSSFLVRKDAPGGTPVSVRVTTLDKIAVQSIMAKCLFAKIDVQGFETQVLLGAKETLARCRYLVVELSFRPSYEGNSRAADVMSALEGHGFRPFDLLDTLRAPKSEGGRIREIDLLFANHKLLPTGSLA